MGSTNFIEEVKAPNAKIGFSYLVAEANEEYGTANYNGSINTCSMGRCALKFDKYTKTNEKKAMDYIEKEDYGIRYKATYVDLGVMEYKVVTSKITNVKDFKAPKYKMKYVVRAYFNDKRVGSADTKTKASDIARRYSLENSTSCYISKEYEVVGRKESNVLATSDVDIKVYKTKPKLKDIPGRKIVPIHKYLFYGWASC